MNALRRGYRVNSVSDYANLLVTHLRSGWSRSPSRDLVPLGLESNVSTLEGHMCRFFTLLCLALDDQSHAQ